ncbi:hypothetical protein [Streptomyces sp. DSM 15324]|uniref:hypothetical protein n=1 Tax=Streptomyces sp. DSM 15324 TaxID=1739111 RepID=UPI000A6580C1|nr:hypothetical protein [Streptomyces sp. DSM 15324]
MQGAGLSGPGRHQVVCALTDLHGQPRHLVNETNLFFAADMCSDCCLALWPSS